MSFYGETGRFDPGALVGGCAHGRPAGAHCARCNIEQTEAEYRGKPMPLFGSEWVDRKTIITPRMRECAEYDAVQERKR